MSCVAWFRTFISVCRDLRHCDSAAPGESQSLNQPRRYTPTVAELVYWNPLRPHPNLLLRWVPRRVSRRFDRPVRNFGDLLAPMIVSLMLHRAGLDESTPPRRRLLAVGSILHFAKSGDVVWGAGRNGRISDAAHTVEGIDVRAVRGPRTREWLLGRGVNCPEVFGDPALLLPMLRPDLVELSQQPRRGVTFVSHMDDPPQSALPGIEMMSPRDDVEMILRALVQSELVIATSLHPVIVAEAFGVPARSIVNQSEPEFKFADYYLSTGRPDYTRATSVVEALTVGGESRPEVDIEPLFNSFPIDLFIDEETSSHG